MASAAYRQVLLVLVIIADSWVFFSSSVKRLFFLRELNRMEELCHKEEVSHFTWRGYITFVFISL